MVDISNRSLDSSCRLKNKKTWRSNLNHGFRGEAGVHLTTFWFSRNHLFLGKFYGGTDRGPLNGSTKLNKISTFIHLFVASFVHSFILLFARLFVRPFVHCLVFNSSFVHSLNPWPSIVRSCVRSFRRSLVLIRLVVRSFILRLSFFGSFVCMLAGLLVSSVWSFVRSLFFDSFVCFITGAHSLFVRPLIFLRRLLFVFSESTSAQTRCNFNRRLVSFFNNILNVH